MTATPSLTPEGEEAWLRLRLHLEWCDSFALVFVFSDQPTVARALRERLAEVYRARVTGLEVPVPQTKAELLRDLLPRLLNPPSYQQVLAAPIWLDLSRQPVGEAQDGSTWQEARLQFLARLNEQREPLRRALTRPLILVLPLAEKARIKALVPDLWAVRLFSLDLGPWLAALVPGPVTVTAAHYAEALETFPLDPTEAALVQEWRRLRNPGVHKGSVLARILSWWPRRWDRGVRARGVLLAGGRAFEALFRCRRIDESREVAHWMVETTRARLVMTPEDPEALRDLSISLDNVGQTDQALGDWTQARAAYAEALEIRRRLLARVGETPEALRDLSVSLNNVGQTDQALGDWTQARAAYAEALEIRRRLLARVGETPEALRDLSVSLDKVGQTDQALGDWTQARAAYAEGLEIAERLAAMLPDHVDYKDLPAWLAQRLEVLAEAEARARPGAADGHD